MNGALTADLVMGLTGSGKSCLAATYADYVWKRHKKVTLYYAIDPGGVPSIVRKYMALGIIRLWRVRTRDPDERLDMAQGTLKKAVQGYWPTAFRDVDTGEVGPGTRLVPPITTKLSLLCPSGHVVKTGTTDSQLNGAFLCPECNVNSSRQNGRVKVENFVTPGFEDVGGRVYDGLTSACEWIMSDLRRRGADIDQGALKSPLKLVSDGMVFGANSETHYGFAQNLAEDLLKSTAQIPDLVAPPIWTANEKQAEDRQTRETLVGPEISGKARTLAVPRWVGNLFGSICLDIDTESGSHKEWRLYLRQYKSPLDGLPRACKTRFSPSKGITLPEFLSDGPNDANGLPQTGEEPFTQFSLAHFYGLEEAALEAQLKQEVAGYQDVPKAPESYGADEAALEKMEAVNVKIVGPAAAASGGKRRTGARRQRTPPPALTPEATSEAPTAPPETPPTTVASQSSHSPSSPPQVESPEVPKAEAKTPSPGLVPPAGSRPGTTASSTSKPKPKPPAPAVARPARRRKRT